MSFEGRKSRDVELDEMSLQAGTMSFLLEDVDRSAYEKALQYIQPLSELEDVFKELPATRAAIREVISKVNSAIASDPDPILSALGLSDSQKELVDACTSAEVLKLSLLNAFDAVRQLLIADFSKTPKIYEDEVIELRIIPSSRTRNVAEARSPKRVPYSVVGSMTDYTVHWQDGKNMIIGPDTDSGRLYDLTWNIPRTSASIRMSNVPAGKIYLTARVEGDPAPVTPEKKRDILGIPLTPKGALAMKLGDLASPPAGDPRYARRFDMNSVVEKNFKIPSPAMGFIESIYRTLRSRKPIQPPNLSATDLSNELKAITLETFRSYFRELVERTTTATGDITTYDVADTLFLGGLSWVSGLLGMTSSTPTAPAPPSPGDSGTAPSAAAPGRSRSGGAAVGSSVVQHSLSTVLSDPRIAAGSTPAERSASMAKLRSSVNQDELRKTLNRLTAGAVVFTEGTVDRWCELAGIKEGR